MIDSGLTDVTYTDTACADDSTFDEYLPRLDAGFKIMTQDPYNPLQLSQGDGETMQTYFTNRILTGLLNKTVTSFSNSLRRTEIKYNHHFW